MTDVTRVQWRETRGFRDPQFEPRDIIAEGNPGNWRFYVQYLFEIRAVAEKPTTELCAEADRRWSECVDTISQAT